MLVLPCPSVLDVVLLAAAKVQSHKNISECARVMSYQTKQRVVIHTKLNVISLNIQTKAKNSMLIEFGGWIGIANY